MPSTSKKQHNFMAAIAHSPSFATKANVPQSVGKDFIKADKGHKFKGGGMAKSDMKEDMKMDKAQDKSMIKKAFKQHDMQAHKGSKGTTLKLAKGGAFRTSANGIAQSGKTKGKQIVMAGGKGMAKGGKC